MLKPERKGHRAEFSPGQKLVPTFLLSLIFAGGAAILYQYSMLLVAAYLALWIA